MKKPEISKNFNIEDIHAIREYNASRRRKLTTKERLLDIKNSADECEKDIKEYRKKKMVI